MFKCQTCRNLNPLLVKLTFYIGLSMMLTSRTHLDIVLCGTLHPYRMLLYFVPDAKCLRVSASFSPGSKGCRNGVVCFVMRGPTLRKSSSNISGGIRMKFTNDASSSRRNSTMSWSYNPNLFRLAGLNHGRVHHLLRLLL